MNPALYIAKRIKGDASATGRISLMGTRIATISVAVSIFIMILSLAIVRGFRTEIERKIAGFTGQISMEAPGAGYSTQPIPLSKDLSYYDELCSREAIDFHQEYATAAGLIKTNKALQGVSLKGVTPDYHWDFFESCLTQGRIPHITDSVLCTEILISERITSMLDVHLNDTLLLYFITDNVRMRKFSVCGIYNAQLDDIDSHLILGDMRQVQRVNGWSPNQISGVEFYLKEGFEQDSQLASMEDFIMDVSTDTDQGVVLQNAHHQYAHLYDWLALLDLNVVIILALMVLVAGFNMISGLLIMLFEKTSMVGLLKSFGMKDRQIQLCFLYKSVGVAGWGVLFGTLTSVAFCLIQKSTGFIKLNPDTYFVDCVPIDLSLWSVLLVDIVGAAAILLLMSLPLRSLVRTNPSKAILMR